MVRERSFFELAATLLPVLLLTGVLTRSLRPPAPEEPVKDWRLCLIIFGVVLGSFAELAALRAVTTGQASDLDRTIVPLALAFAIAGLGAAIVGPWLGRLAEEHPGWRRHYRLVAVGLLILISFWGWTTVQLYRSIFQLGDLECVAREAIDWPGGPESNIFEQGIVPRQLALDQIAIFRARRGAKSDGTITKDERSELGILKLLLDNDVNDWKLELDLQPIGEC
jgi:MFS family permease